MNPTAHSHETPEGFCILCEASISIDAHEVLDHDTTIRHRINPTAHSHETPEGFEPFERRRFQSMPTKYSLLRCPCTSRSTSPLLQNPDTIALDISNHRFALCCKLILHKTYGLVERIVLLNLMKDLESLVKW